MPKISKPPKPAQDFSAKGQAVVLAELAEALGMHVRDVLTLPDRLAETGLPVKFDRWVIDLAQRVHRDQIEAVLFRAGGTTTMRPLLPPSTPEDRAAAPTIKTVAEAEAKASQAEAERRKATAKTAEREERDRTASVTRKEAKALAAKVTAQPVQAAPRKAVVLGRRA